MRAAVYSGTRNVYENMLTAAKSLLIHSNVEKIYFLIEDDTFPYELRPEFECINVSEQNFFPKDGPNFKTACTYMVLLRAAYSKIFPNLDRILTIDMDTVVNENISELWDLNLDNYYLAAVEETALTREEGSYINMGVAMLNLKKIREDGEDDKLIHDLNTYWYRYGEQDCFNEHFRGKILILPSDYNVSIRSAAPNHEKITHFAAIYNLETYPNFNYYKKIPLDKIQRNVPDKFDLDIIIPTYKNKKELRRTLHSITTWQNVNVIIVDDCSQIDYTDILIDYPQINLYTLSENCGPGVARQFGIEQGKGSYITFLDTGDYFYENGVERILNQIQDNTYTKMYSWSYVYDDNNVLRDKPSEKTIGIVYKRTFIEMYSIKFSKEGSYANEDFGFVRASKMILKSLENVGFQPAFSHIKIPIFFEHIDNNSLTKKNNCDFFYTKLPSGIIINGTHAIDLVKKYVSIQAIIEELNYIMSCEYYFFLSIAQDRMDLLDETWSVIRKFYLEYYRVYEKFMGNILQEYFSRVTMPLVKSRIKNWEKEIPININKFLQQLRSEELCPIEYLT